MFTRVFQLIPVGTSSFTREQNYHKLSSMRPLAEAALAAIELGPQTQKLEQDSRLVRGHVKDICRAMQAYGAYLRHVL